MPFESGIIFKLCLKQSNKCKAKKNTFILKKETNDSAIYNNFIVQRKSYTHMVVIWGGKLSFTGLGTKIIAYVFCMCLLQNK